MNKKIGSIFAVIILLTGLAACDSKNSPKRQAQIDNTIEMLRLDIERIDIHLTSDSELSPTDRKIFENQRARMKLLIRSLRSQ